MRAVRLLQAGAMGGAVTQWQARAFIALDEWLGIFTAVYLYEHNNPMFGPFVIAWAVFVYGLSYLPYWKQYNAGPWRKR